MEAGGAEGRGGGEEGGVVALYKIAYKISLILLTISCKFRVTSILITDKLYLSQSVK